MRRLRADDTPGRIEGDADLATGLIEGVSWLRELSRARRTVLVSKVLVDVLALLRCVLVEKEWLPTRQDVHAGVHACLLQIALADVAPRSYGVGDERDTQRASGTSHVMPGHLFCAGLHASVTLLAVRTTRRSVWGAGLRSALDTAITTNTLPTYYM